MHNPTYDAVKGLAYPVLATIASCDHATAKAKGFQDGWQMLMDRHDGDEMAMFCTSIRAVLSEGQAKVLLDGLAREYTHLPDYLSFVDVCIEKPNWRPSKGKP